jgi:hypothetical protein
MSQLEVDKVIPQSGTTLTLGDSADTITIPSGATLDASNATLTLPDGTVTNAKVNASAAIDYSKLNLATSIVNADISTTAAIATTKLGAGAVLQVVSTTKTDTFSTSSISYSDVTGLSVSITPSSASNKILVIFNVYTSCVQGNASAQLKLLRDSTAICIGDTASNRPRISGIFWTGDVTASVQSSIGSANNNFLDSPNTTSSITYKIQMASSTASTSVYINRSDSDRDTSTYDPRTASTITVMEIKG